MRRASAAHNPGVSLFPFLAVLICTMGVMMLLLVIINRPGAAAIDDSEPPPGVVFEEGGKGSAATLAGGSGGGKAASDELAQAREMLDWRISQLQISREKTVGDLRNERLRLTTVEEGMRKLRDQWDLVKKAAGDIAQADTAKDHDKESVAAFVDRLKSDLNATHAKLGQAIQDARSEPPAYAIVPYDGPNGTRRQPIYIECRSDAIVLQPEGIAFTEHDFDGPKGPGNPLASTIRTARDYLAGGTAPVPGAEPYPLLIVRSDGVEAFYRARSAMSSWASDFGYELIEADRKLVFQRPDPRLAQVEQAALADARARYAWFATTRTGHEAEQTHERPVYRASRNGGGIEREGQASLDEADGPSTGSGGGNSEFGSPGNRFGVAGTGGGGGGTGTDAPGTGGGNWTGSGSGTGNGNGNGTGASGGALAGGQAYVPGSNYVGLPGGGGPGGPGNGTGGSGYGTGGSPGGVPGGLAGGPGNGSGNGNGAGSGVGSGNGSSGGQPFVPGSNYIGLPGSGGAGGSGTGTGGSGYGTGGSPGGVPGGLAGGPGNGNGNGSGNGNGGGSDVGSGNGSSGGQPYVPGSNYIGLPGSGGPGGTAGGGGPVGNGTGGSGFGVGGTNGGGTGSGTSGGANTGYAGSPGTSGGMSGSGLPGAPGGGVATTGFSGGNSSTGYYPAGAQNSGYTASPGSNGTSPSGSFNGNNGAPSNNLSGSPGGSSDAAGSMTGDPNSTPPSGSVVSNITLGPSGGTGGASGSPNGDGDAPSGASLTMPNKPQQPPKISDIYNINATPYPMQTGPTAPHPGEYVPSEPAVTYSDKPKPQDDSAPKTHDSLAEKRGHNWSFPSQAKLSTPVSRTVHIECRGDRLILKPDFGNPQPRVIMFGPRTADSVDKLVAAVWDYTKGWGIAGRQMYWKPRLELEPGLSGEGRYSDLQALLADSGLEVARKQSTNVAGTQLR